MPPKTGFTLPDDFPNNPIPQGENIIFPPLELDPLNIPENVSEEISQIRKSILERKYVALFLKFDLDLTTVYKDKSFVGPQVLIEQVPLKEDETVKGPRIRICRGDKYLVIDPAGDVIEHNFDTGYEGQTFIDWLRLSLKILDTTEERKSLHWKKVKTTPKQLPREEI